MFAVTKSGTNGLDRVIRRTLASVLLASTAALAGCSSVSKALGTSKHSPDEFAVITKAPLVMPPDFSLRPPKAGSGRAGDANSRALAEEAVFGKGGTLAGLAAMRSDGERMLIASAGAEDADNSIRDLIDSEYFTVQRTSDGFANKILFWKGETVDPATLEGADAE